MLRAEVGENSPGRGVDVRSVVVAGEGIEVLGDELRQQRGRSFFHLKLRAHQDAGDFLANRDEQPLEQQEGLLLIFVDRLLLRIAAEVDDLPQRVERRQMLLPVMVERLNQDLLLDVGPAVRINAFEL